MPAKTKDLKQEKLTIISDILVDDVMPISASNYWSLDMLLVKVRQFNIDNTLHINKFDIKKAMTRLSKLNKHITMHLVDHHVYFKFY